MSAVKATWKNGQVVLDKPADWPEGHRLIVREEVPAEQRETNDGEQDDDPEAKARWIAAFDAIPPIRMTAEEEAAWQAARKAQRDTELATFQERAEKLQRACE
jgi:hypothetical protein